MGTQNSEFILILVIEKESKSLEKISNGKVCSVTARNPLHAELHTRSGLSVVSDIIMASMGLLARSGHSYKQKEKNTNVSSLLSKQSQVSSSICDRGTSFLFMFISLIYF